MDKQNQLNQTSFSDFPSDYYSLNGDHGSLDLEYNVETGDFSHAVFKYINDILMEEDLEDTDCMLQDSLALQAAEKSLYDALGQDYPLSLDPPPRCVPEEDESEQLRMIDNSFLRKVDSSNDGLPICPLYDASWNETRKKLQENELRMSSRIMGLINNGEMVDFWTLLTQCAEAVASGDLVRANQLLTQIRQHSSPFGDGNQRLAHYFAIGLESRLVGTENVMPSVGTSTRAADFLKAYQMYVSVCPFRKMSNTFTNRTIAEVVGKEAKVHIIDFGISYGFQWPCFFQRISARPGGPLKIRITGIDLPQPNARPTERVEETGRRLRRVAERLGVEFEYKAIAQRWESIQLEDLEIDRDEVIAVICMNRLQNLPDDSTSLNSPRDTVLQLIKRINPDVFVHGVTNGSYNAPFFTSRFREALFHYSALFDILEANVPREDLERLVFEREMIGKAVVNVIACEGEARVERPETYKQWHARISRIGFRQLPLQRGIMNRVRNIKSDYHESFIIDEDGQWVLLGWKGRIVRAISAWKPVQDL